MKTPSLLHPLHALRGLRSHALAAITLLAAATASAALVDYQFTYSGVPLGNTAVADGVMTLDDALFLNPGVNGFSSHTLGAGQPIVAVSMTITGASSGNGTFTTTNFTPGSAQVILTLTSAINLNIEWVGQGGLSDFNWFGNAAPAPRGTSPNHLTTNNGSGDNMQLVSVKRLTNTALFTKGDAVPGAGVHPSIPTGATFTSFGVPSINESGTVAFLGKWNSTAGYGTGIFAAGALVVAVGYEVVPASGVNIKSMKDPVIDDLGNVAFPSALIGTGISATNDSAIVSNAPGGVLAIVAQEGTQAAEAPAGALWKSFTSTAAPGGGGGVLILGFMAQGAGGITAANDNGLWSADGAGALHLLLQEGTTAIGAKTVKSFAVLKALSGTPGQTHAHNTNAELVSKVTFTDGFQAIVHTELP